MAITASTAHAVIAVNRFGLGAKSGELAAAQANPKQWLIEQLQPVSLNKELPNSNDIFTLVTEYRKLKRQAKMAEASIFSAKEMQAETMTESMGGKKKSNKNIDINTRKLLQKTYRTLSTDTFVQAMNSDNSLSYRLLDFFSNHFSVTANGLPMGPLSTTLEREAIADNLLGNFEDMLLAVTKHPAMIIYLNNEKSVGPSSKAAKKDRGLNENLAREILELHTLGVTGGYNQNDVIELAKAITGWSVASRRDSGSGFMFRGGAHEPGNRLLLGKKYTQKGIKQGEAMLLDLARHPNTAKHICSKLVKHFISDQPSEQLVASLQQRWQATNGNIKEVMIALINHQQAWLPQQQKFKTPREFVMSTYRALGMKKMPDKYLFYILNTFGQQPMQAGSPAGYSDEQEDWNGGNALMARIEWTATISKRKRHNAEQVMQQTLALNSDAHTYKSVVRAESRQAAMTLMLMSPEFLRR
ncbi:DUF1800 family protein [Colwelliaceae bacterium BS250]